MNTPPTNEWREDFDEKFTNNGTIWVEGKIELTLDPIKDFIQNLLDQHSAQIVERLEKAKITTMVGIGLDPDEKSFNQALDQAIDIVKDNK